MRFLLLLAFIFAGPAAAGDVEVELRGGGWAKICGAANANGRVCYTARDFFAPDTDKPTLAFAVYDTEGKSRQIMRFLLPVGLLMDRGFDVSVDGRALTHGRFKICFANGCYADAKLSVEFRQRLLQDEFMQLSVTNQAGKMVMFQLPLDGFATAFKGAGITREKTFQQPQQ
ncbi:MAG: invasion associated locus B family protein [Hyphomicrobiales bacterium]|nr:invasion associated locus B family protein [Hyphomicrobiales bacterium]